MPAVNLELRKKISGSFANASSLHYVATHVSIVAGLLDSNDKLQTSLFPDWIFTTKRDAGTIEVTTKTFEQVFSTITATLGISDPDLLNGAFIRAGHIDGLDVTASTGHVIKFGDDGITTNTTTAHLEKNDQLVFIGTQTVEGGSGYCKIYGVGDLTYTSEFECEAQPGGVWEAGITLEYIWAVVNNSYPLAIAAATTGASSAGIMSAALASKLFNIEANANNYTHESNTVFNLDLGTNETIDSITTNSYGHVTNITKQTIVSATNAAKGLIEIATHGTKSGTLTEMEAGTSTTLAATPAGVKSAIEFFSGLKLYNSIATDNTAASAQHPDGAFALFVV